MRIPKMSGGSQYRVTVPALDGGVNLKDAPNLVEDNQLTDVLNMWWKDQALRTRPGLTTDEGKCVDIGPRFELVGSADFPRIQRVADYFNYDFYQNGKRVATIIDNESNEEESGGGVKDSACLKGCTETGEFIQLAQVPEEYSQGTVRQFAWNDGEWFAYTSRGNLYFHLLPDYPLEQAEPYHPLVAVNGKGYESDTLKGSFSFSGTMFEGFNSLINTYSSAAFKTMFTADGKATVFPLPVQSLSNNPGETVEICFTQNDGNTFIFQIAYDSDVSDESAVINSYMTGSQGTPARAHIDRDKGLLYFQTATGEAKFVAPDPSIRNNLVVTAWVSNTGKFNPCDMQFHMWFGGDTSGINGGTRLFMSGDASRGNLVCWSDANNPLYFPENNYAYIGESDQAVTAFGKQADMLVIFKEHEMFYATYQAGGDFTAQDVIDGKVVDVTAQMARFPVTQINPSIGCDCPQTIQLCNNRLVWATSEGKVYTLTDATPYSERNVRELSGMIESHLKAQGKEALQAATSGDFDGHYVLQVGDWLYLLDYNTSGFENNTSYLGRNAEKHMPWSIWHIGLPGVEWKRFFSTEEKAVLIGEKEMNNTLYRIAYTLAGDTDALVEYDGDVKITTRPILSRFQTKVFDFGQPERRKKIRRLHIGATDTAGDAISLSYVTEQGAREDALRLGAYGTGEMREWCVTPGVNRVRQFGIRAESKGAMAVDNMTLKYEVNGEVR